MVVLVLVLVLVVRKKSEYVSVYKLLCELFVVLVCVDKLVKMVELIGDKE